MSIREVFRPSVIDLRRGRSLRGSIVLAVTWLFYRTLNAIGFNRCNDTRDHVADMILDGVAEFAAQDNLAAVYNYQTADGRVVTVFIANVRDTGDIIAAERMHV